MITVHLQRTKLNPKPIRQSNFSLCGKVKRFNMDASKVTMHQSEYSVYMS